MLNYLTSTVGLITTRDGDAVNVMAAEWTSFVAQDPLHIAIAIQKTNYTHDLLLEQETFAVTLCDTSLAAVADLCGSFSGRDIDKSKSDSVPLAGPTVLDVPHVVGGVLNAECLIRHTVDLPGYTLFVGEAVWFVVDDNKNERPLVKHGHMYQLGPELHGMKVCVVSRVACSGALTVVATAHGASATGDWYVEISDSVGQLLLEERVPVQGDLQQDFEIDLQHASYPVQIQVRRTGCASGTAFVSKIGSSEPSELSIKERR